jgi:uncharacterized protein GlcG (DUF336 family)
VKNKPKLELEDIKKIFSGAENETHNIGVDMDIAVVDDGGNLVGFEQVATLGINALGLGASGKK